MFSLDDHTYMTLVGILSKKSYIHQVPRSMLEGFAFQYNISDVKQFKTKKALVLFLLRIWSEYFEKNPEFYKAYQERYGEFSLANESGEEKDEETQIQEFQEMCRKIQDKVE